MIPKALWPAALAVAFSVASLHPAHAQREVDLFFGIAGEMIRLGAQNDQIKRQQTQQAQQQRAADEAQRAAQQAAEFEFYSRAQTALKTLGYYNMAVDGATGPGTRAAIAAYQVAFRLPDAFDQQALFDLEWRASEGWRSLAEIEAAETGGFSRRDDFIRASEAGFLSAAHYKAAVAHGFADAEEYDAFVLSGAPDKSSFETTRTQLAAANAAIDQCLTATQAKDWSAALAPCYAAAKAKSADAGAQLALEAVLSGAQTALVHDKAELADKRAALAKLLNGASDVTSSDAVAVLRGEVNLLAETVLFTELHLQSGQCSDLVARRAWDEAVPACHVSVSVDHLAGEKRSQADELVARIAENRGKAEAGAEAAKADIAAEANRLALLDAKTKAASLVADVSAFDEQGKKFAEGIAVAREVVALRQASEGNDAVAIERHFSALEALLGADEAYVAAQSAMATAREQAGQAAVLEARRQAEMLEAFVLAYVSSNVMSSHVPALLPLSETLGAALGEGNAERITSAQAAARQALEQLGLGGELASFSASHKAPVVSAEQLDEADAQTANASMALQSAINASETLVASITSFAESGGTFADTIGVARGVVRVKAGLARPSLPDLQVAHDALALLVGGDANFVAASTQRSEVNDAALANAIASAREELTGINEFLLGHISANLTDDDILSAVDLQMAVETALAGPASAEMVRTLKGATEAILAMDLSDSLAAYINQQAARSTVAEGPVASNGLAVTPANSGLLQGAEDDLLVLRNSGAPHLVYDLVGNLRVDGGLANACWTHVAPESPISLLMARQQLGALGIDRINLSQCDKPLDTADLVVLRRGDFLALPPSVARPLVAAFEDGRLKSIVAIEGIEANRESNRLAGEAASIASRIGNATLRGFGLLQLTHGEGGICPAVADLAPHGNGLAKRADSIAFFFAEPRLKPSMSAEQAFVAAQRGECTGIYAASADLRTLSEALEKADIAFTTAPIWVEAEEVENEVRRLAEISAEQVKDEAAREQAEQATAALDAAKTADQRSELEARQAALRDEYEERATGARKDIADLVRELVQTGKSDDLAGLFPQTFQLIRSAVSDKWVITDTQDDLADYGTAVWQGRAVEAILVRVTTKRENSILGLYGSDCVVLGHLVDREFRINRDSVEATCSDEAAIAEWAAGREMKSIWHLEN